MSTAQVKVVSDYVSGEHRVDLNWTLERLTAKLEPITGIPPKDQRIQLLTESGEPGPTIEGNVVLEHTGLSAGWTVCVADARDPEDRLNLSAKLGEGEKYEMPRSEYEKREGTVLEWKKKHKLGRFDDSRGASPDPASNANANAVGDASTDTANHESEDQAELRVKKGDEIFVRLQSGKTARGTVEFIGPVPELAPGRWVGVRLLTPDGKNNGTVKGIHLFDAQPNHGTLVRPNAVRPLDEDEEEL